MGISHLFGFGFHDEADRPGSFAMPDYQWLGKLWPRSDVGHYRVVCHDWDRRYGLQALVKGQYVEVMAYDDGYDDYGRFRAGRWVRVADRCRWSRQSLEVLAHRILGEPEPVSVVTVIT